MFSSQSTIDNGVYTSYARVLCGDASADGKPICPIKFLLDDECANFRDYKVFALTPRQCRLPPSSQNGALLIDIGAKVRRRAIEIHFNIIITQYCENCVPAKSIKRSSHVGQRNWLDGKMLGFIVFKHRRVHAVHIFHV